MAAITQLNSKEWTTALGSGAICVLGVGNRQRRDDGVGSVIAGRLAIQFGRWSIDAGSVPENHLEKVARLGPETVLLIDAVDFAGVPGEIRLMAPGEIADTALSTHALSLRMTADYLQARTGARLGLLAVQPAELGMGEKLSATVSRSARDIENLLKPLLCKARKNGE